MSINRNYPIILGTEEFSFCPHCGAKMDAENEDKVWIDEKTGQQYQAAGPVGDYLFYSPPRGEMSCGNCELVGYCQFCVNRRPGM